MPGKNYKKFGRPSIFKKTMQLSIRVEEEEFLRVKDIAALETASRGRLITAHELIRQAVHFVYGDGERMRECFRRSRQPTSRKFQ
jgi:hypothetical protein